MAASRLSIVLTFLTIASGAYAGVAPPVLQFNADHGLNVAVRGQSSPPKLSGAKPSDLNWVSGRNGKTARLHLPPSGNIQLAVDVLREDEGTLMFWFRPDWPACDFTFHPLARLSFPNGSFMELKKGYSDAISPDYTYFVLNWAGGGGTVSCAPDTLFTPRQWRHYTIRWSRARQVMDLVVDGCLVRSTKVPQPPSA
jgi:hypothetical protein